MKAVLVVLLVAGVALAGCGDKGGKDAGEAAGGQPALKSGKGAISGLVINDVYRPVPGALVLASNGLTATSDGSGQFTFLDLEPGAYVLRAQADGHEAAPQSVEVVAGEYAEAELMARRVANQGGRIITTEYSVFVPCAFAAPAVTANPPCLVDLSGDTDRFGFNVNYTGYPGATYLVTEMKANREASQEPGRGAYKVVVRDGEGGDPYYSSAFTTDSDYLRLVMQVGTKSLQDTEARNQVWNNTGDMQVAFFPQGAFKAETQQGLDAACASDPTQGTCFESRGVGAQFGIRARFIQSLFIGEPEVDIATYGVLD